MPEPRTSEVARAFLRYGVLACVLLAPLPFASVQPAAVMFVELAACVLGAVAVGVLCLNGTFSLSPTARRVLLVAAVPAIVGVVQLLPAPAALSKLAVARTFAVRSELAAVVPELAGGWSAMSIAPANTLDATLRFVAYVLLGLAAYVGIRGRKDFRLFAVAIVVGAVFQAIYGASQYLSGNQAIFGYDKVYYLDSATGTFINRNHFAIFLCMSLPFAYYLAANRTGDERRRAVRLRFLGAVRPGRITVAVAASAAFCIWLGLLLSHSRACLVAAILVTCLVLPMVGGRHRFLVPVVGALCAAVLLTLAVSTSAPGERFLEAGDDLGAPSGRVPVWRASLALVPGYLVAGSGLGSFDSILPTVQPPGLQVRYDHAHNDWLQMLIEGGLPILLAALGMLVLLIGRAPEREDPFQVRLFHRAGLASVLALALHGLVDFPIRIPAVAVLAAVCVAICAAAQAESVRERTWIRSTSTPRSGLVPPM